MKTLQEKVKEHQEKVGEKVCIAITYHLGNQVELIHVMIVEVGAKNVW